MEYAIFILVSIQKEYGYFMWSVLISKFTKKKADKKGLDYFNAGQAQFLLRQKPGKMRPLLFAQRP
jgi:hypothetical protein